MLVFVYVYVVSVILCGVAKMFYLIGKSIKKPHDPGADVPRR